MSRHVWLTENFSPATVMRALPVFRWATTHHVRCDDVCTMVGYMLERQRQGNEYPILSGYSRLPVRAWHIKAIYKRFEKTGHRYRYGRNRSNYLTAGRKLLEACAWSVGLVTGTPWYLVYDYLMEKESGVVS